MPRPLFVDFARVGDLVMAVPLMRALASQGELHLLARPYAAALLAGSRQSFVSGVHVHPHPNHTGLKRLLHRRSWARLERELRAADIDVVYRFAKERRPLVRFLERTLGEAAVCELQRDPQLRTTAHYSQSNDAWLRSAGIDPDAHERAPRLEIHPEPLARADALLAPFPARLVAVQMGSHTTWRTHPLKATRPNIKSPAPEQWAALIAHLLACKACDAVTAHGVRGEAHLVKRVRALLPAALRPRLLDCCGTVPLPILPAVLHRHQALISCDTGPAHVAAAVGCPVLVFFGPSDPVHYTMMGTGPVEVLHAPVDCAPCLGTQRAKHCHDNRCLTDITLEQMIAGWDRLLARADSKRSDARPQGA
ncbi:MAG: glycosyltransferase family 9 protein [Planctomycetota bacterium]